MERYKLNQLFDNATTFVTELTDSINTYSAPMIMGLSLSTYSEVLSFIGCAVYGYFYDDLVAYVDEDDPAEILLQRLGYDVAVKLPYWYKKYNQIKKLLTTDELSLLQTSKMTSSSSDKAKTASGTLQKTATTPTGVITGTSADGFEITLADNGDTETDANVNTEGFVDKYTNAQQKFANATRAEGERSGEVLREGSIDELLNVLEKLPASFADEVTRDLQKHFIFDYDGERKGIYNEAC